MTPNDLAGLSCEESALSRLVIHEAKNDRWALRTGPFAENSFAKLPKKNWTLLVQDVDKWDMDVATLLDRFAFLPRWRIDDIMVSYAVDGGSVGAHVDQYDVFLIQGMGQRRWQISTNPKARKDFRADAELKLLQHFEPTHEWILEPGDMLYLPPDVPHHGVALGECMTFSVGMRAPSQAEMIVDLADYLAEPLSEECRYIDPDLAPVKYAGEIDEAALCRVQQSIAALSAIAHNKNALSDWFGRFITQYRSAQTASPPRKAIDMASLQTKLHANAHIVRHPWVRFAWQAAQRGAVLYISGQSYHCSTALAQLICRQHTIELQDLSKIKTSDHAVLVQLINAGYLVLSRVPSARRSAT